MATGVSSSSTGHETILLPNAPVQPQPSRMCLPEKRRSVRTEREGDGGEKNSTGWISGKIEKLIIEMNDGQDTQKIIRIRHGQISCQSLWNLDLGYVHYHL